ncbi:hypothetical protein [Streptomyces phaeochromogenes]|uniref:hypothetical protein n=1 Tax=Streptomyces phaeochromogenes TaxID=1923 RepID=UPI002DD9896E|nr:hypothetical protein [Streptomyces phaeochromogenes]WRZ31187.1 hypothetical protein OG931_27300 [Streptomyces phaeochromogenes]
MSSSVHAQEQSHRGEEQRRTRTPARTTPAPAPALGTAPLSPAALLSLQRSAGNAAVARLAVQRVPTETQGAPAPTTEEPRSVFDFDSDSESDAESDVTATQEDNVLPFHKSLFALRKVIRAGMNSEQGKGGKWTVTARIDPGAPWTSAEFRNEDEVGHVWLELTSPVGDSTTFGFYPRNGAGVLPVPGEIICPDHHGGEKEQKTAGVGLDDVLNGYRAALGRVDAKYHLATYNCASFASDVWRAMTGNPLPSGMVISNPASAAESVRAEREMRKSFNGQEMTGDMEDLIEMVSSGHIPPAL